MVTNRFALCDLVSSGISVKDFESLCFLLVIDLFKTWSCVSVEKGGFLVALVSMNNDNKAEKGPYVYISKVLDNQQKLH